MKAAEYHAMSDEQLDLTLKETIKNLFHLRVASATDRLETPSEIRKAKKDIARIKTIQRQRELAAAAKAAGKGAERSMSEVTTARGTRRIEVGGGTHDKLNN